VAAKSVFENDGFLDARISDIAAAAGLSHGSFYHYFDSKEQIFREVAEAQEALLTAPDDDHDQPGPDEPVSELDRIRHANRRYLERYRDNAKIMGVIEEVSRYDASVNEGRMRRQKLFAERAERAIRRLQRTGEADTHIDPALAAVALGSMVGRFAELWLVEGWSSFDFDDAVEQVTRLWANAIGVHEPSTRPSRATAAKRGRRTGTTPRPKRSKPTSTSRSPTLRS
jgi:AcrR family transcriptional regulator